MSELSGHMNDKEVSILVLVLTAWSSTSFTAWGTSVTGVFHLVDILLIWYFVAVVHFGERFLIPHRHNVIHTFIQSLKPNPNSHLSNKKGGLLALYIK